MPYFVLDSRFSVGVPLIDEHHQHLIRLLNRAYDNFINKGQADDLGKLFDELIDYAIYHFSAEEQIMQDNRFPGLELHKKEHETFRQRVVEMDNDFHRMKGVTPLEILTFLYNWFSTHILESDAEIGRFLAVGKPQV